MSSTSHVRSPRPYAFDRRPLSIAPYRRLWTASALTAVVGSFSVVAVPAQLFALTGSSAAVGAAAAVAFVALAGAALWTGAVVDAGDARTVLLAAHGQLALTYAVLGAHAALGGRSLPLLMVLVACQGTAYGAIMTATGAVVPRLVPPDLLPAANSLSALTRYTGAILGPVLAGALLPAAGLAALYLCDAVTLLAVLAVVARLPSLPPGPDGPAPPRPARSLPGRILTGFRHLAADRLLRAVLAVDLAAMVLGMPTALFPELARHVYGGPPGGGRELGLLYAAYPAGVLAAGLLSGTFTRARRHGALLAAAAAAWGATVVVLGLAPRLWVALAALGLGGAVNFVLSTFRTTISQARTDEALRGRIQGSLTVVLIGGPQLANLLHGTAGSLLGPRTAICAGGLLTLTAVAAVVRAVPELRHYAAR
ncbi:MFS transporter [Streptomyces polyrhachis]|uniref:MFS transporter n=1 Tax=Streptomyces polyrhachis TaxID=1282885 RepID=A0ABW2GAV0_9ACTN